MLPLPKGDCFHPLEDGRFQFACHPGVSCFNQCCRQLTLWLTPYDFLRLRRNLGLSSDELLDRYCTVDNGQNGWPLPRIFMEGPEQVCPFVSQAGCRVYPDRPGACRTYPLGRAVRGGSGQAPREEGYFLVKEEHCQGFQEGPQWTPQEWMEDQGLAEYNRFNDLFAPILTRQAPDADPGVIARKMQMMFMACYKLESFRRFVATPRFRQTFDLPEEQWQALEDDELSLLEFAFSWLRFAIFGESTLPLRPEVAEARRRELEKVYRGGL
jgi:hypothetical protein